MMDLVISKDLPSCFGHGDENKLEEIHRYYGRLAWGFKDFFQKENFFFQFDSSLVCMTKTPMIQKQCKDRGI